MILIEVAYGLSFSILLFRAFIETVPRELDEAAIIDGAGHWTILWHVYLPLSTAALATLTLFAAVTHWNACFDGLVGARAMIARHGSARAQGPINEDERQAA